MWECTGKDVELVTIFWLGEIDLQLYEEDIRYIRNDEDLFCYIHFLAGQNIAKDFLFCKNIIKV